MNAALVLDRLACIRGGRLLFEDLSLTLGAGHAALVIGPNGIGKSSLLRVVAGLLGADGGCTRAEGGVALADERLALDADRTLADATGFWRRIDGGADGLAAMDLLGIADVPVRMLSTGQRKRAALAMVIGSGAGIWLLDEPANGLDQASEKRLEEAMAAHRAAGGIVVAAAHQPLSLPDAQTVRLG